MCVHRCPGRSGLRLDAHGRQSLGRACTSRMVCRVPPHASRMAALVTPTPVRHVKCFRWLVTWTFSLQPNSVGQHVDVIVVGAFVSRGGQHNQLRILNKRANTPSSAAVS